MADGTQIGIGFMLAVAVSLALGRIFVRAKLNRKVYVDDGFFCLALVTLVAGTVMTYVDIPYIYLQQNVQAGTQAPPADFIQQLLKSVKIQDAAVVLLSATVFAVKLAFLAFFRGLIRRLKKLEMWWWCVLVIVVISSLILICANFITCPYFDERILGRPGCSSHLVVESDSCCDSQMCVPERPQEAECDLTGSEHPGHP